MRVHQICSDIDFLGADVFTGRWRQPLDYGNDADDDDDDDDENVNEMLSLFVYCASRNGIKDTCKYGNKRLIKLQ